MAEASFGAFLEAAAKSPDRSVILDGGVIVRNRRRKRKYLFFVGVTSEGLSLDLSFKSAEGSAGFADESLAQSFDLALPGAVIARVEGTLEPFGAARAADLGSEPTVLRCPWKCGDPACVYARGSGGQACRLEVPVLRVSRIVWASADSLRDCTGSECTSVTEPTPWLLFDMGFDGFMTPAEHCALIRQVSMVVASNRTAASPFRLAVAGTTVATEPCSAGPCSVEPCSAKPFPATEAASEVRLASSSAVETECLCQSSARPAEAPADAPRPATVTDLRAAVRTSGTPAVREGSGQ